jgi:hypothetical protein
MPQVTYDREATDENYEKMCRIFGDILPVRKAGEKYIWFAPWDELIRWWGVEDAMLDLVDRPEMVEAAISRLVDAYLCELDQWEALNLLSQNDDNTRIGSGGYGYTPGLPGEDYDPACVRPWNLCGNATAQIFGSVSPGMHWDFGLKHEMRWLERWRLTYYGCCEPLDAKMSILRNERCLDGPLSAAAAVGVGEDGHGGGAPLLASLTYHYVHPTVPRVAGYQTIRLADAAHD